MIYFIYPNVDIWEYMVDGIEDNDVICRPLNPNCNKLQLLCRKIFNTHRLPAFMLFGNKMRNELRTLSAGDTVLIPDYIDVCLFKTIASIVKPEVKKCLWIWNPVKPQDREKMHCVYDAITKTGFEISTFDKGDSELYNQKLYSQFFRMKQNLSDIKEEYDFYFIGFEKNRSQIIRELKEKLKDFRCYFKVIHNVSECVPYAINIENIKKTRCIIEIVQQGQTGITLRPLEALACRKKLLTTNKSIKQFDFYSSNNIFIVGEDDYSRLEEFMTTPISQIDETVLDKYNIQNWVKHFK